LLPHLIGGLEKSTLTLDLLVDRGEGIIVVVHDSWGSARLSTQIRVVLEVLLPTEWGFRLAKLR
jgi:hypothetical protein